MYKKSFLIYICLFIVPLYCSSAQAQGAGGYTEYFVTCRMPGNAGSPCKNECIQVDPAANQWAIVTTKVDYNGGPPLECLPQLVYEKPVPKVTCPLELNACTEKQKQLFACPYQDSLGTEYVDDNGKCPSRHFYSMKVSYMPSEKACKEQLNVVNYCDQTKCSFTTSMEDPTMRYGYGGHLRPFFIPLDVNNPFAKNVKVSCGSWGSGTGGGGHGGGTY